MISPTISNVSHTLRRPILLAALAMTAFAGGCANDSPSFFTTGSLSEPVAVTKVALDPACVTLASQIDGLRKEGTVERLEKAADGKTSTVSVQRASLTKQAQLNKANAEFISKCGPALPKSTVAAATLPAAATAPVAAALATTAPAKAMPAAAAIKSGVTSAANSGVTIAPQAAAAAAAAAKAAAPQ
jgi:hypothetical protein